jgi:S1-C subfamily serine protease
MRYSIFLIIQLIFISMPLSGYADINPTLLEKSVVKIYATLVEPDYRTPWRLEELQQISGSGAIISQQRILTNAHVVTNAKYIQIQKPKDPNKYVAEIQFIAHEIDLAILIVKDKNFFRNTRPLALGNLSKPYQEVAALGYPMGGETLSITKGVLSRYEYSSYVHANQNFLLGQIDAAINPGNSGGPVIVNEKMIGLVVQEMDPNESNKIGYFVPSPIIAHFLKDIEDGIYNGFPLLGISIQPLKNPAAKSYFGLKPEQTGVLVNKVLYNSESTGVLQENDVLLKIDQFPIADDGSITYNSVLQTFFHYIVDLHYIGDKIQLTFFRKGKIYTQYITAQYHKKYHELIPPYYYEALPRYYIYAGIVFMPVTRDLLKNIEFRSVYVAERYETDRKTELIIALKILSADVNFGYEDFEGWLIDTVNNIPIKNFAHFCQLLENNKNKYVIFADKEKRQIVINHAQALTTEMNIFKNYGVPARYSVGLLNTSVNPSIKTKK